MPSSVEATGFLATGAVGGISTALAAGKVGIAGSVSFGVGFAPIVGVGILAGAAAYGAVDAIQTGDAMALGAVGLGAIGGMSLYAAIGGVGIAGGFGAIGVGFGAMTVAGGAVGLGVYGVLKMLDSPAQEPAVQAFARMESRISAQEAYVEALIELNDFLSGEAIKRRCDQLELDDELDKLKAQLQRQKLQSRGVSVHQTLFPGAVLALPEDAVSATLTDHKTLESSHSLEIWFSQLFLDRHEAEISAIAISADGQTIATASHDQTIILWNIEGKKRYTFCAQRKSVLAVAISPDNQTLVSGGLEQIITSWNLATKAMNYIFLPAYATHSHHSSVQTLAFSPDGKTLVSGSADRSIRVWRHDDRHFVEKLKRTLSGHTDTVLTVAIASDQQTLVSGSADQTIRVWDLQSWRPPLVLSGHTNAVTTVAIDSDNNLIISGSSDCTIKVWNLTTGELIQTLNNHVNAIISVAINAHRKIMASSSYDGTINIWSIHLPLQRLYTLSGCGKLTFSSDGRRLICGDRDGSVKVFTLFDRLFSDKA